MVMSSKTARLLIFFGINFILLIILYIIPVDSKILSNICLIKYVTGNNCFNCGMTRAFLSILHLDLYSAYQFNHNVIIVFPLTIILYLYTWYKYIFKKGEN